MSLAESTTIERSWAGRPGLVGWLSTVDHKRIGLRYLTTAGVFFCLGGVEALVMRAQLAQPGERLVTPETYNQLFSMHGITMIFLFATPMLSGFGNYLVPLQLGVRDMAFPRLNALGYWLFLGAGSFMYSGLVLGMAPDAGWFSYLPLSGPEFDPGRNIDFYGLGLILLGISTSAGAVNFIVTILKVRAPGMSLDRLPLYCWAMLATSFAVIFAIPSLTAACALLELDRIFDFRVFDDERGGDALLWQHLFWIFGHPDVYIIFLPAVGIVSSIIPTFARRPMVAHSWTAIAMVSIAFLGFGVWVHHMFAVGLPNLTMSFFAAASLLIAVPSAFQMFAWLATLVTGAPLLRTPLLYVLGFLLVFVIGGVTGVMFAVIPFDQQVTDSYFVVAHFHYVLVGGAVFPMLAGLHYWLPKLSGRVPDDRLGQVGFWIVFIGFNLTFFPMHISGLLGMPRRVYTYPDGLGWSILNLLSTIGAGVLAAGFLFVIGLVVHTILRGPISGPNPWDAPTLEWATESPPPAYDFRTVPLVRSAYPLWDDDSHATRLELAEGHRTTETSVRGGELQRILEMPGDSLIPLALAVAIELVFIGLLTQIWWLSGLGGVAVGTALAAWHRPSSQAATS